MNMEVENETECYNVAPGDELIVRHFLAWPPPISFLSDASVQSSRTRGH